MFYSKPPLSRIEKAPIPDFERAFVANAKKVLEFLREVSLPLEIRLNILHQADY